MVFTANSLASLVFFFAGLVGEVDFGLRNELGRNTEWCLVLATVLGRREMVAEQLLSNLSLWRTYRDAAYNAAGGAFGDFVDGVEALLEEEA